MPFDNDANSYTSTNTQDAIEETRFTAGVSSYAIIFSYNGVASDKFLQLFQAVASDASPYVVAETGQIKSLSISVKTSTTTTITIYVDAVAKDTVTITAGTLAVKTGLIIPVVSGSAVSAKVTDGSASDPILAVNIKTLAT